MKKIYIFLLAACLSLVGAYGQKTITVKNAGTLRTIISQEEKKNTESIIIEGEVNSEDIAFLSEMSKQFKLKKIDLGKAKIVKDMPKSEDYMAAYMIGDYADKWEFNLWISSKSGFAWVDYGDGNKTKFNVSKNSAVPTKINQQVKAGKPVKLYGNDITAIRCFWNKLTAVKIDAPELEVLWIHTNDIANLDMSKCPKTKVIDAGRCGKLRKMNIKGLKNLEILVADESQLEALDLEDQAGMQEINIGSSNVKSLDMTHCTALKKLNVSKCKLTTLNLSGLQNIEDVRCWKNQIDKLDLSAAKKLKTLDCSENNVQSLLVNPNSPITKIECYYNNINAEAYMAFVKTLPDLTGKEAGDLRAIKDSDSIIEKNVITKAVVKEASKKNWIIKRGYSPYEPAE